jgi:hypothetical protein
MAGNEQPLAGKPAGWAAGLIYGAANLGRQPVGVPGLLNSEFTKFFGVSMETVRRRAARIVDLISI